MKRLFLLLVLGLVLPAASRAQELNLPEEVTAAVTQGDVFGPDKGPAPILFRTLLQVRNAQTFFAKGLDQERAMTEALDGWRLQRMFLRIAARPAPWLETKVLADFAEPWNGSSSHLLKLAYADLDLHERVHVRVGLHKLPMSLLELLPIAEFELADLGFVDDLIKNTGFGGRDVGATLRVDPLPKAKWLRLSAGAYTGQATATQAQVAPLLGFRAESHLARHLRLGADWLWRRNPTTLVSSGGNIQQLEAGTAGSADIALHWKPFEVRAEMVWGDRSDVRDRLDARSYLGAWLIAVGRIKLGKAILRPVARFEVLDADRQHDKGRRELVSGAVDVDVGPIRFALDVSQRILQSGSLPVDHKVQGTYLNGVYHPYEEVGSTRVVLQMQVAI